MKKALIFVLGLLMGTTAGYILLKKPEDKNRYCVNLRSTTLLVIKTEDVLIISNADTGEFEGLYPTSNEEQLLQLVGNKKVECPNR